MTTKSNSVSGAVKLVKNKWNATVINSVRSWGGRRQLERDVMNCEDKDQERGFWEAEKADRSMFY